MERYSDFSNLRKLIDDIFGFSSSSFISYTSTKSNFLTDGNQENLFPKENDANFNKTEEVSETETHKIKKETWTSLDGSQSFVRTVRESKAPKQEQTVTVEKLEKLLDEAVRKMEYEEAARIRDEIKKLKKEAKKV